MRFSSYSRRLDVVVVPLLESGRAHAQENEIDVAGVGDALGASCRDDDDISRPDVSDVEAFDVDASPTVHDDVAFVHLEHVERGGHSRLDARARDRDVWIAPIVPTFEDVTSLGRVALERLVVLDDSRIHDF